MANDPQSMAILNGANIAVQAGGYAEVGFFALVSGGFALDAILGSSGEVAAGEAGDVVTVSHFTSAENAAAIGPGGSLSPGSWVTMNNLSEATAEEAETYLEIGPGKGAFSTTFETPISNLSIPSEGSFTSGGASQFQVINPTPVSTFVPSPAP